MIDSKMLVAIAHLLDLPIETIIKDDALIARIERFLDEIKY